MLHLAGSLFFTNELCFFFCFFIMAQQFFQAYGTADGNSGILDVEFQRMKAEKSGILGLKKILMNAD